MKHELNPVRGTSKKPPQLYHDYQIVDAFEPIGRIRVFLLDLMRMLRKTILAESQIFCGNQSDPERPPSSINPSTSQDW